MNYYISNGTFYAVPKRSNELYHYGVPGMKWGVRKKPDVVVGAGGRRAAGSYQGTNGSRSSGSSGGRSSSQARAAARNTPEAKAVRAAKAKKALKIGAAVAGTALAAYGTYKLAQYMQGKRSQMAMSKAQDYINNNVLRNVDHTTYTNGMHEMTFKSKAGEKLIAQGTRREVGKIAGQHNAEVVSKARQMYKDSTNTKVDKALAKVVNAGDKVKSTANKAKNKVLDVVNPKYEYVPSTTSTVRNTARGGTYTETVTNYIKTKKKRT